MTHTLIGISTKDRVAPFAALSIQKLKTPLTSCYIPTRAAPQRDVKYGQIFCWAQRHW